MIMEMLEKNFKTFKSMPDEKWKKQVYKLLAEHTHRGERISYT